MNEVPIKKLFNTPLATDDWGGGGYTFTYTRSARHETPKPKKADTPST
jgi:hypothetical protein